MKPATYYEISFVDLDILKQSELINDLSIYLTEQAKAEGEEFLALRWNDPKPKTWQEAYCRTYNIEYMQWNDYAKGDDPEVPAFMWETWQEEEMSNQARLKLDRAFRRLEVEVEL